jgi:hypothetical protein
MSDAERLFEGELAVDMGDDRTGNGNANIRARATETCW